METKWLNLTQKENNKWKYLFQIDNTSEVWYIKSKFDLFVHKERKKWILTVIYNIIIKNTIVENFDRSLMKEKETKSQQALTKNQM
jgi:hypothetical protein